MKIQEKEKEWYKLVGKKRFKSLDKKLRDFLINTAGIFDFGFEVDIKKAYKYSIYDDEIQEIKDQGIKNKD